MGIPVLILGESGSGKSASLRNFEPEDVGIFNVAGKPPALQKGPAQVQLQRLRQDHAGHGKER